MTSTFRFFTALAAFTSLLSASVTTGAQQLEIDKESMRDAWSDQTQEFDSLDSSTSVYDSGAGNYNNYPDNERQRAFPEQEETNLLDKKRSREQQSDELR